MESPPLPPLPLLIHSLPPYVPVTLNWQKGLHCCEVSRMQRGEIKTLNQMEEGEGGRGQREKERTHEWNLIWTRC